jgi:regulation of enolase protein 1 (concanavalin A-like superfamily)
MNAQATPPTAATIPGIPFPLAPSADARWTIEGDPARVTVLAGAHTDIFVDPGGASQVNGETLLNAATLLGTAPDGDFRFSAHVRVAFAATFDAGVLLLWFDEGHWAKLCLECSPDGEPMVVSVVNRGVADDANAFVVPGESIWLRVSRVDSVYAYHASDDGEKWRLVRAFVVDAPGAAPRIGFEAQSPTGKGCAVSFTQIGFDRVRLGDLRDGT